MRISGNGEPPPDEECFATAEAAAKSGAPEPALDAVAEEDGTAEPDAADEADRLAAARDAADELAAALECAADDAALRDPADPPAFDPPWWLPEPEPLP